MYESFYGITRRPFLADPDPGCCAGVGTMQQAYDELYNCFEQGKGIGILTGPSGTGKTLLCLNLLDDLSDLLRGVFLAGANFSNRRFLLQAILYELDRPYRGLDEQELRVELITAAKKAKRANRSILLVVDEAHLLNETLLEEIRSATNLIENGESLVRVLLSGQMSLEETMTSPALDALNQRVACHQSLETLTRQQSIDYIEFRLKRAGANVFEVFTAESLQMITEAADGNPRCLNQLCDHALFLGYAEEQKPIETTTVRAALEDLKQLPLHWNDLLSTADVYDQSASDSTSEDSFSDDSLADDSYLDGSLIEEASAEPSATVDVEASTEKTEVFEIGVEEAVEAAETENCFEWEASEETDQLTEMESVAHETSLESDRVNGMAALESGVGEHVAIPGSNLETLIRPLEIDTT
ncbi:MAG: AAA family ATPase, partial [Planctomycetes bacterium]|nr:AAA family ATPase [Planctomycetota bacterium]